MKEKILKLLARAKLIQDVILTGYPNPERKGCPGTDKLREYAHRKDHIAALKDPMWDHIKHCSPCYREFLDLRKNDE